MNRRRFLGSASKMMLSMPLLGSRGLAGDAAGPPKRLVCFGLDLSLRPETFFPGRADLTGETGSEDLAPLLAPLKQWKGQMTAFSSLEHPGVSGGHAAVHAFLSGVRREQRGAFPDGCLSLDQLVAQEKGHLTRFPSMTFGVGGGDSIAWTRSGVSVPKWQDPAIAFEQIFAPRSAADKRLARSLSEENREVAGLLQAEAKRLDPALDSWDREKLAEYVESVHSLETKIRAQEKWIDAAIPEVEAPAPTWSADGCIDKVRATMDVMTLALKSDATRVMTCNIGVGLPVAKRIEGVDRSYHDLSHSGRDPKKLAQLHRVESALMNELDHFLSQLDAAKDVDGASLLDNTVVLFGSGMGNASSHSNRDLPVLIAGGGLQHAESIHLAADRLDQTPLCNVYVTLLHYLGVPRESFGTSTGDFSELLPG